MVGIEKTVLWVTNFKITAMASRFHGNAEESLPAICIFDFVDAFGQSRLSDKRVESVDSR